MDHDDRKEIDGLTHEVLIRLDDGSFQRFSSSIESLVRRHLRTCKECDRRHNDLLEAYRRSLPAEKQQRIEQVAILLAGKITEQFNERKHIRYAVQSAITQGKVDPAMEAFEKVLKRHRNLEQIAAAMARDEVSKVVELAQELRLHTLENWAEGVTGARPSTEIDGHSGDTSEFARIA
jgi:hypothetical protein